MNRTAANTPVTFRCAIYTRKSTEDGLEQEFNSLDAQREAGEAYIASQKPEGWVCLPDHYDDGGFSGGNMDRPALQRLLADIEAGKIDCIVVYKVDRLSRSLIDFSKIMEVLERHKVSFVSVIADVISSVAVTGNAGNALVQVVEGTLANLQTPYDLIVDYKAGRRPAIGDAMWEHHQWQIQTYAWLRSQLPHANRVGAGILVYVSELAPSKTDLGHLLDDIRHQRTDVVPQNGSADFYAMHNWNPDAGPLPQLSQAFRFRRAIRVVNVAPGDVAQAVGQIDAAVAQIEQSALAEHATGDIKQNWAKTGRERDCVACDFKHFCPMPHNRRNQRNPGPPPVPTAPG